MENIHTFYYARASSSELAMQQQLKAFHELGACDGDIYKDKQWGKDSNRPGYQALKETIGNGDTLVIASLSRISRSKVDIAKELQFFHEHNIRLKVLDLPTTLIEFSDFTSKEEINETLSRIMIEIIDSIAKQEVKNVRSMQSRGTARMIVGEDGKRYSRKTGKPVGRPVTEFPPDWQEVYNSWNSGKITAAKAMEMTGTKRTTFYKLVKLQKQGKE